MILDELTELGHRLGLNLPEDYRRALLDGATFRGSETDPSYFEQDFKELLIENLELRMCSRKDAFAGAPWPDTYVCIGQDGCGNYYCIDADDPHCSVMFFDHEADVFESLSDNLPAYFTYISNLHDRFSEMMLTDYEQSQCEVAAPISPDVVLARTDVPRESVLNPISLEEWISFVVNDPDLELRGYRSGINPFTNEEVRFDSPGLAVLATNENDQMFRFVFGRVLVRRPGPVALAKLDQAAIALNAKVIQDW